jgi:hypothetical protein
MYTAVANTSNDCGRGALRLRRTTRNLKMARVNWRQRAEHNLPSRAFARPSLPGKWNNRKNAAGVQQDR